MIPADFSVDEIYISSRVELWTAIVAYDHGRISSYVPTLIGGFQTLKDRPDADTSPSWVTTRPIRDALTPFIDSERIGEYSFETMTISWNLRNTR